MNTTRLLIVALCSLWLSACQSGRVPAYLPPVREYSSHVVAPARTNTAAVVRRTIAPLPEKRTVSTPVKTQYKPVKVAADTSRTAARKAKTPPPTLVITGSDTLVGYPVNSQLPSTATKPASDPKTTLVNAAGGVIAAVGLGFLIAGLTSESSRTEWGGLRNLVLGFYGLLLLGVGIPLLFFQGKNGRLRQLRQDRKAAEAPLPATPAVPDPKSRPMSKREKAGLVLIVLGTLGILTLLVPIALPFLFVPLGLLLLVIGLTLTVLVADADPV